MIMSPRMLAPAAIEAGMAVPSDPVKFEEEKEKYPHFFAFCVTQLNRPVRWGEHWDNAQVIAAIPADKILKMTLNEMIENGLEYHGTP